MCLIPAVKLWSGEPNLHFITLLRTPKCTSRCQSRAPGAPEGASGSPGLGGRHGKPCFTPRAGRAETQLTRQGEPDPTLTTPAVTEISCDRWDPARQPPKRSRTDKCQVQPVARLHHTEQSPSRLCSTDKSCCASSPLPATRHPFHPRALFPFKVPLSPLHSGFPARVASNPWVVGFWGSVLHPERCRTVRRSAP